MRPVEAERRTENPTTREVARVLSFEQIKELANLVARAGLAELEIERSGFRLHIVGHMDSQGVAAAASRGGADGYSEGRHETAESALASDDSLDESKPQDHVLTSPIVGTFYLAPSPDASPFVAIGDRVNKGDVVCIVEAMKLMNEIESDVDGVIVRLFPKNAQAVEFGEPLFAIRTDG